MVEFEKNPNPTKDQHFMVDKDMLNLIYETANIEPGESIVEIGGGEGALTNYLMQGSNYVTVIEKDPYYAQLLKNKYDAFDNVTVIEGDALTFDFSEYDRIVANLPYTITEPFLINLASSGALDFGNNPNNSNLKSITLILSQNSLRKMIAPIQIKDGSSKHLNKEFGIMGAICHTLLDTDIVTAIPSKAFFPEPAVTSFLVNFTPKKEKTTVDRIMKELLTDKKGNASSIKKIYQLMLYQGKLYKMSKHKNNTSSNIASSFTSSIIENKNIYSLSNDQLSQLIKDLIRNDINIKARSGHQMTERNYNINNYNQYLDDNEDDIDEDFEDKRKTGMKNKFESKYEYLYDDSKYLALLNRGLENLSLSDLQTLLGNSTEEVNDNKGNMLKKSM